ncbi:hypothetical protein CVT26_002446, partial [Gymnopilus dilepis]
TVIFKKWLIYPGYTLGLHWAYPRSALGVPWVYPRCSLGIPWGFHRMYDVSCLDKLEDTPVCDWVEFASSKLGNAPCVCSNNSAPKTLCVCGNTLTPPESEIKMQLRPQVWGHGKVGPVYNGRPCHEMGDLWDALHNTYNAASDRTYDVSCLDELEDTPVRDWVEFSSSELKDALHACSNNSAPGPDHITWKHLKVLVTDPEVSQVLLALANACLRWDSQSGSRAKELIGKPFMFRTHKLVIEAARSNPGTPLCTRCWRWGHPAIIACRAAQPKCACCAGPHTEDQHRHYAGCCKGDASADPPVAPTPAGQPCPHTKRCPNCGRNHSAYERACKFWSHRFDREWFVAKYAEVRAHRLARLRRPPNHPHVD